MLTHMQMQDKQSAQYLLDVLRDTKEHAMYVCGV